MSPKRSRCIRTDPLRHGMNLGKQEKLKDMLRLWRRVAPLEARSQWRDFFEGRGFRDQNVLADEEARSPHRRQAKAMIGGQRLQMVRAQVAESLRSWLSNRQNEFSRMVNRSGLSPELRWQVHTVNRRKAWFSREPVPMKGGGVVPEEARRLARRMMREVMDRHRRPSWGRMSMRLDARAVKEMAAPRTAGHFGLWLRISTLKYRESIYVPCRVHSKAARRGGVRCNSVLVSERRDGSLSFGWMSDMTEEFEAIRDAYVPETERLSLDFGLRTMFATDQGDLLGRGWFRRIRRYDKRITSLAAHMQSMGRRPTESKKYRELRTRLRGHVTSEVNRVLNRLVRTHAPGHLVLERLNFHNPDLSRRMNRLLQNCGRSAVRTKLKDLEEKYGITHEEVNPAYTSQECHSCGYVDRENRKEEAFKCLWCGKVGHADVNGSRVVGKRRSLPEGGRYCHVAEILDGRVRAFVERWPRLRPERTGPPGVPGRKGRPADPRTTGPYFGDWLSEATSMLPEDHPAVQGAQEQ